MNPAPSSSVRVRRSVGEEACQERRFGVACDDDAPVRQDDHVDRGAAAHVEPAKAALAEQRINRECRVEVRDEQECSPARRSVAATITLLSARTRMATGTGLAGDPMPLQRRGRRRRGPRLTRTSSPSCRATIARPAASTATAVALVPGLPRT